MGFLRVLHFDPFIFNFSHPLQILINCLLILDIEKKGLRMNKNKTTIFYLRVLV
jgi:hypothetical protein